MERENLLRLALRGCSPEGAQWTILTPGGVRIVGDFREVARAFFSLSRRTRERIKWVEARCGAGHRHRIRLA